ncbi:hypothetical protein H257_07872 [Aphanomyces astaci]|uniref:HTH CENPB-type domain-containing protein n=1 Tax=Aphanomyces astaci TaxID=112090 RepID=W4GF27_APHAT|nr:hypothetical protein H257_07872 [Aphanomyces astaci]ETV78280.1 hypothetical protein H257_07872 [Aphanomyces astaci]|eukprot:XP_009831861.1 hypothetical protein H257_07872 [Aphanomyces astaci]
MRLTCPLRQPPCSIGSRNILATRSTSRILRDKRKIETYNIKEELAKGRYNVQGPKYPELDKQVAEWVVMANAKNACVTGELIARKGLQIATELNLQDQVKCSHGWLYAVDVLTAMKWSLDAWENVTSTTIRNCWNHTGIVPRETLMEHLQSLHMSSGHLLERLLNEFDVNDW